MMSSWFTWLTNGRDGIALEGSDISFYSVPWVQNTRTKTLHTVYARTYFWRPKEAVGAIIEAMRVAEARARAQKATDIVGVEVNIHIMDYGYILTIAGSAVQLENLS